MTLLDSINEFKLENAPTDCIQSVKFGKNSNQFLLAASWDSTVRLYDIFNKKLCSKFDHPAPVLDCAFQVRIVSFFICAITHWKILFVGTGHESGLDWRLWQECSTLRRGQEYWNHCWLPQRTHQMCGTRNWQQPYYYGWLGLKLETLGLSFSSINWHIFSAR